MANAGVPTSRNRGYPRQNSPRGGKIIIPAAKLRLRAEREKSRIRGRRGASFPSSIGHGERGKSISLLSWRRPSSPKTPVMRYTLAPEPKLISPPDASGSGGGGGGKNIRPPAHQNTQNTQLPLPFIPWSKALLWPMIHHCCLMGP